MDCLMEQTHPDLVLGEDKKVRIFSSIHSNIVCSQVLWHDNLDIHIPNPFKCVLHLCCSFVTLMYSLLSTRYIWTSHYFDRLLRLYSCSVGSVLKQLQYHWCYQIESQSHTSWISMTPRDMWISQMKLLQLFVYVMVLLFLWMLLRG